MKPWHGLVSVRPETAKRWLGDQLPRRPELPAVFAAKMRDGRWEPDRGPNDDAISLDRRTGQATNGIHRLTAISMFDRQVVCYVLVGSPFFS